MVITDENNSATQGTSSLEMVDSGTAGIRRKSGLFHNRAFAKLFGGSVSSSLGSSAGSLAIIWLVYAETGSAFDIALIGIFGFIPRITFGIIAGALADRYNRLRLMILADSIRALTLIIFAASLIFTGFNLFSLLAAVFILGIGQSLFRPAINSFLPVAVEKDQLANANGLFSIAQEVTSVIGSPLGGILIAVFGTGLTLTFNSAGYLISAMFIAMVAMSVPTRPKDQSTSAEKKKPFFGQVKGGIAYIRGERGLLKITLAAFGANFFLAMFFTFLVIYVNVILAQGALVFGLISASMAAGFGVGSLLVGRLHAYRSFGKWYTIPWGIAGLLIFGLVLIHSTIAAIGFLFTLTVFGGFGNNVFLTAVQKYVPNDMLARYLSLDEVGSFAAVPVGQIAGGIVISFFGLNVDFTLAAIGTAVFTLGLLIFSDVRTLHVE